MIRIIQNPKAGRGAGAEKFSRFLEKIRSEKIPYALYKTQKKEHGRVLARELSKSHEPIVIAGGDGSIYDVINGMDTEIPIAIVPIGTGNDIAKTLGIKFNVSSHVSSLKKEPKLVDYLSVNNKYRSLSFVGFGIVTTMVLSMESFKNNSSANYFFSMIPLVFKFKAKTYEIEFDNKTKTVVADFVSVHNCVYAGGGMYLGHGAKVDDGLCELLIIEYKGAFRRVLNLIAILCKNLHKQPNVSMHKINKVSIYAKNDFFCCIDGEIIKSSDANINVVKKGLKVLY